MEDIHEYNYQQKGCNKYVFHYTFSGEEQEKSMIVYDKTEDRAKRRLRKYWSQQGCKINFTHVYVC